MTVSYNLAAGGLHYSPERDFSYNYPRMVSCVIRSFNVEYWPALLEVLAKDYPGGKDALWQEVCKAKDAYCEFLNSCCQDPAEKVGDVLDRAGFTALPEEAKIAWSAMLGEVVTGQIFQGVRDVTAQGTQSSSIVKLLNAGMEAAKYINKAPTDAGKEDLVKGFKLHALVMREQGVSQQEIRQMLSEAFNSEQYLV